MPRVLITGASGFVGRHACRAFRDAGWDVRALVRRLPPEPLAANDVRAAGDLATADLSSHLAGVDCVVHLAARAHRIEEGSGEQAMDAYHAANVGTTRHVAAAARAAGVRRFVLVSTAKVFGEERQKPYSTDDAPAPADAYARTKLDAERALLEVAGDAMETVIVRPPMVYGPGGKGNVPRLIRLARVAMRVPLPLGAVRNRRSLLYVGNLASALVHCATSDRVAGAVFTVADGTDVSTPELIRRLARVLGGSAQFLPVPPAVLRAAALIIGRGAEARRLLGSLVVDSGAIRATGWIPPCTLDEGLRATAEDAT